MQEGENFEDLLENVLELLLRNLRLVVHRLLQSCFRIILCHDTEHVAVDERVYEVHNVGVAEALEKLGFFLVHAHHILVWDVGARDNPDADAVPSVRNPPIARRAVGIAADALFKHVSRVWRRDLDFLSH